ncbi:MAG TPA: fumarylacetoacetate hydrolase family protein [bacterium]|nr:fumarylacetoacetate hydrolase family protein [bacterium]HPG45638.1 fumarylacetoacetate hydrolase family protein [bacterium]HPM97583.1 fumarylacetoacetate hydrolase family protein [bacterium]
MRAFSFFTDKDEPRIGIEIQDGCYDFTTIWEFFKDFKGFRHAPSLNFLQVMVEMEYFALDTFTEVVQTVRDFRPLEDVRIRKPVRFDVPISRPQKILCLGRNYRAHAEEWGSQVPDEPIVFAKLSSSLLPHEGIVRIPDGVGRVDHEIELAVVIGKKASRIAANAAMEAVAGYTIVNDVTARDLQLSDMKKRHPWTLSKGFDTFCPLGPYLVPAAAVVDPHNLKMELQVNSESRQRANTRDMVVPIPEIIAFISRHITLLPGDIICTGTPEGTLPIQSGDLIEATIDGLGVLRNRVAAA